MVRFMIIYARNACTEIGQNNPCASLYDHPSSLPIVDVDAFREGMLPKPDDSSFVMVRLHEEPRIIAVDASDDVSHRLFGRMSSFVEQTCRTSIPSLEESPYGAGYDLRIEDIAEFFTKCRQEARSLNPVEQNFLTKLLAEGLLMESGDGYIPLQEAAVIGVNHDLPQWNRDETIMHELAHGFYFVDTEFRSRVDALWECLDSPIQHFLRGAMIASGYYNCGEDWLLKTETHAYAAESLSNGNFISILEAAEQHCKSRPDADGCSDFWSFEGGLYMFFSELHELYTQIPVLHDQLDEQRQGKPYYSEYAIHLSPIALLPKWKALDFHKIEKHGELYQELNPTFAPSDGVSAEDRWIELQLRFDEHRPGNACDSQRQFLIMCENHQDDKQE